MFVPRGGRGANVLKRIALLLFVGMVTNIAPALYAAEEDTRETSVATPSETLADGDEKEKPREGKVQTKLDEVVVTATRLPSSIKTLPVAVEVITRSWPSKWTHRFWPGSWSMRFALPSSSFSSRSRRTPAFTTSSSG